MNKLTKCISISNLSSDISFSVNDVYNGLSALCSNLSVGPNGFCGEFILQLISIISYLLWLIINMLGYITPIPKFSSYFVMSNYIDQYQFSYIFLKRLKN